jgi:hypothetical protein
VSDARAAAASCRVAAVAAALAVLGLGIDASFWTTTHGFAPRRHLASAGLAATFLVLLAATHRRPRRWLGSTVFLLNNASILAALWWSDGVLSRSTPCWNAFDAQKLGAIAVALLAPPVAWVGLVSIAGFSVVPIVEFLRWDAAVRAHLPTAPWACAAYGVFACGLYAHQLRRHALEERAARAEADAAALERFARMVLAMRDLANTPLQTIQLTAELLRRGCGHDPRLLDRLTRTCDRLLAVTRVLEGYEIDLAPWRRGDEAIDLRGVLRQNERAARRA